MSYQACWTFQPRTFQPQTFPPWTFQPHGSKIHGWKVWGWKVQGWSLGLKSPGLRCPSTAGDAMVPQDFDRSVNLISTTRRADYAHHITTWYPRIFRPSYGTGYCVKKTCVVFQSMKWPSLVWNIKKVTNWWRKCPTVQVMALNTGAKTFMKSHLNSLIDQLLIFFNYLSINCWNFHSIIRLILIT